MERSYRRPILAFLAIFTVAGCGSAMAQTQAPLAQPAMVITQPADGEIFSTAPILVTLKFSHGADPAKMRATLNGRDVTQFFRRLAHQSLQASLPVYVLASGSNLFQATDSSLEATIQFSFEPPPAVPPGLLGATPADGPDMTNVQDVLQGQDFLMRDDDMVVIMQGAVPGCDSCPLTDVWTLPTFNSGFTGAQNQIFSVSPSTTPAFNLSSGQAAATALGRFYNTSNDVVFTLVPGASSWKLNFFDPATQIQYFSYVPSQFKPAGSIYTQIVMGDFTRDGLDSALLFYVSPGPQTQVGMNIATASDVNTPDSAVTYGPQYYLSTSNGQPTIENVVAGDFSGNGGDQIAALMTDNQTVQFYTVDPKTLTISAAGSITLPHPLFPNAMAAGRFRNAINDDLIVTGQIVGGPSGQTLDAIQMTANPQTGSFTPKVLGEQFLFTPPGPIVKVLAQAAPIEASFVTPPLAGATGQDQLVMVTDNTSNGGNVEIGDFDTHFNFIYRSITNVTTGDAGCVYSMAIGNFDRHYQDGSRIPNLQIATYWTYNSTDCNVQSTNAPPQIVIWDMTPNLTNNSENLGNWLNYAGGTDITTGPAQIVTPNIHALQMLNVVPGDVQGRSLRLGSPEKVTITGQVQPDLVLGIPPMHVDWIAPNNDFLAEQPGCNNDVSTPCVVNLTVKPTVGTNLNPGFSTGFNFQSSSGNDEEHKSTTSWGVSVKTLFETKIGFTNPLGSSVSTDIKLATKTKHDSTVSETYNHYNGQSDSMSVTTSLADQVFFTQQDENIYYYPVLGQTVCPQDDPDCPDSEKVPLYVDFSVPSVLQYGSMPGTALNWYQPVHEPGNIFSYPWSLPLLQQQFSSGLNPLTETPAQCTAPSSSTQTYENDWTINQGQTSSSAASNAFSADLSVSGTTGFGDEELGPYGEVTLGLDVGGSTSFQSLNVSTQSQSASKGVAVTVPRFDSDLAACCTYGFSSYILGTPNSTFQSPQDAGVDTTANVLTTGPMYVEFLADPVGDAQGLVCGDTPTWWEQVYDLPDVGLNHPARWNWSSANQSVSFNPPDTSGDVSPLGQPFYQMKGFFITEANDAGKGPTIGEATAGDQLALTVRVYNFSLVDTNSRTLADPAASVHVAFYGQNYCSSGDDTEASCVGVDQNGNACEKAELCGNAFKIGETTIGSIPGFKSVNTNPPESVPNWTTASVNFDTTDYANSNLVFWVVAWMEDAKGNLVPEMPGHRLTENPEGMSFTQITQVPIEPYSNNVGMYPNDSSLFVAPASAEGTHAPPTAGPQSISLSLPGTPIPVDRGIPIMYTVSAGAGPTGPVSVALFDGNPTGGGQLEDLQSTAPIAAGSSYSNRLTYQPASCGVHTLVAVARTPGFPSVLGSASLFVTMDPVTALDALAASTQSATMPDMLRNRLLHVLVRARTFFKNGDSARGEHRLNRFIQIVQAQRGRKLSTTVADALLRQASHIPPCLGAAAP